MKNRYDYTLCFYCLYLCNIYVTRCQRPTQCFQARDAGVACEKWLMVNVQNVMEFSCQILNRDVWSNKAIKTVIKEHFIFWQVHLLIFMHAN